MPYVPHFEVDVFVSYATANNQPMNEGCPGWITSVRSRKETVDRSLRARNVVSRRENRGWGLRPQHVGAAAEIRSRAHTGNVEPCGTGNPIQR